MARFVSRFVQPACLYCWACLPYWFLFSACYSLWARCLFFFACVQGGGRPWRHLLSREQRQGERWSGAVAMLEVQLRKKQLDLARAQSFRKITECLSPRFSSLYCHISFCNLLYALYSQQKYFFLSIEKESIAGQAVDVFYRSGTKRS